MDAVTICRRGSGARTMALLGFALMIGGIARTAWGAEDVVVLTTDFATGAITTLPVAGSCTPTLDRATICGDPVARSWNDRIYVVNRFGCDNIQVLDPFAGYATLSECSVGSQLNPQDIAVVNHHRAYVTRYETNELIEIDPETCTVTSQISLAGFADVDGLVEMHRMFLRGDRLYVQLQRLDRRGFPYLAEGSLLAVVDITTNTVVDVDPAVPGVQAIDLAGENPVAPMQIELTTGYLLVPEAGLYGVMNDGGIERVDLRRNRSAGFALPGAALNADLVDFAQGPGAGGYAVVADAGFNTLLVRWNSLTGTLSGALYAPGGYVLSDLLTHGGKLFVADRDFFEPGIRVWDLGTEAVLCGGVVPTGLPPFELLVRPDVPSEAPEPSGPVAGGIAGLGGFAPNPTVGAAAVRAAQPVDFWRRAELFDSGGRRVARLVPRAVGGGTEFRWDGRDETGRPARSGVYFLRVETEDGRSAARRLDLVR